MIQGLIYLTSGLKSTLHTGTIETEITKDHLATTRTDIALAMIEETTVEIETQIDDTGKGPDLDQGLQEGTTIEITEMTAIDLKSIEICKSI